MGALRKLTAAIASRLTPARAPSWDLMNAARTWWQEARGEPIEGQRAVAHVIVNRLKSGRFGKSFWEVCLSDYHGVHVFSGWNYSDPNRAAAARLADNDPSLAQGLALIQAAIDGEPDPTGGATHYYNPAIVKMPKWALPPAELVGVFGNQLFFRKVP